MQLDLFADAPVFYFRALDALGRLDPAACRALLDEHGRRFPRGPDPRPAREAADWLEAMLPGVGEEPGSSGVRALAVCRALREGRAAGFSGLGGDAGRAAARMLALRTLASARAVIADPSTPLGEELPWGALLLWTDDDPGEAQRALEGYLAAWGPSTLAYLALGDCLWRQGREHPAFVAFREGYLAEPDGGGWLVECPPVVAARRRLVADPEWGPEWWAVGAYLEGTFPRFGRAGPEELRRRWERFQTLRSAGDAPRLFAAGLLLSEHTEAVLSSGYADLVLVRRTLQELHPEAWARHRETLGSASERRR